MAKRNEGGAAVMELDTRQDTQGETTITLSESRPIRVGDTVYVRSAAYQCAGVADPMLHPAMVLGIHADGKLALRIFGRSDQFDVLSEDPTGVKMETWHRR